MARINLQDAIEFYAKKRKTDDAIVKRLVDDYPALDEDGYPSSEALQAIEMWNPEDCSGWLKFIESIWWGSPSGSWYVDSDSNQPHLKHYVISTYGWSGNESIINSMNKNLLWDDLFYSHHRGGHYILEVDKEKE